LTPQLSLLQLLSRTPCTRERFLGLGGQKASEFEFAIAAHTLAELYAVLSTLPTRPRISPSVAWRLIRESIELTAKVISLTPSEYSATIKQACDMGLAGGIIYDALIARSALKARVDTLLTLNRDHFEKVWSGESNVLCEP